VAVKIRLRRIGAKKQPAYRIVIADSHSPRDGRFIEIVGHYNPLADPTEVVVDNERALHWLRNGAQPTEIVQRLLVKTGVWSAFTGEPMPEPPAAVTPEPAVAEAPAATGLAPEVVAEEVPVVEPPAEEEQPVAEAGASAEETIEAEEETAEAKEQSTEPEEQA